MRASIVATMQRALSGVECGQVERAVDDFDAIAVFLG
jgi:hypothetical protein